MTQTDRGENEIKQTDREESEIDTDCPRRYKDDTAMTQIDREWNEMTY